MPVERSRLEPERTPKGAAAVVASKQSAGKKRKKKVKEKTCESASAGGAKITRSEDSTKTNDSSKILALSLLDY